MLSPNTTSLVDETELETLYTLFQDCGCRNMEGGLYLGNAAFEHVFNQARDS